VTRRRARTRAVEASRHRRRHRGDVDESRRLGRSTQGSVGLFVHAGPIRSERVDGFLLNEPDDARQEWIGEIHPETRHENQGQYPHATTLS
jgi:hypothetical protein